MRGRHRTRPRLYRSLATSYLFSAAFEPTAPPAVADAIQASGRRPCDVRAATWAPTHDRRSIPFVFDAVTVNVVAGLIR